MESIRHESQQRLKSHAANICKGRCLILTKLNISHDFGFSGFNKQVNFHAISFKIEVSVPWLLTYIFACSNSCFKSNICCDFNVPLRFHNDLSACQEEKVLGFRKISFNSLLPFEHELQRHPSMDYSLYIYRNSECKFLDSDSRVSIITCTNKSLTLSFNVKMHLTARTLAYFLAWLKLICIYEVQSCMFTKSIGFLHFRQTKFISLRHFSLSP